MKEIILFISNGSERTFYELLSNNSEIPLKHLCRKVPRKMIYKYLRMLESLQSESGVEIYRRKPVICSITGLPGISIERRCSISLKQVSESETILRMFS
jgi:hypothetical protein